MTSPGAPLLQLRGVSARLPPGADRDFAVSDVDLEVAANEIVCVVGESGSGKSMLAGAIVRLPPSGVQLAGSVRFDGRELDQLPEREMRQLRGAEIGMVFQEPMTALNPLHTIGRQIAEVFRLHGKLSRTARRQATLEALRRAHLPDPVRVSRAHPHQLSGGERQRAMIAMALALGPKLLIADEPTTALDVTTQAQILALIRELQERNGMGILFITHDFGVVADIADRVVVMQAGVIVEQGPVADVIRTPRHPYTQALIAAVPSLRPVVPPPREQATLLSVRGLSKAYRTRGGLLSLSRPAPVLRDVSLALAKGGSLGIVGESGSGKSTLARCIVRLLEPDSGSICLDGVDFGALRGEALRRERHRIQMVFQDTSGSLNPRRKVGDLVGQGLMVRGMAREEAWRRARDLLGLVRLDPAAADRYPHEFSGGQRQRIGLARALAVQPGVLVADEPVSALDVSVQAQVLALLADLRVRLGLSLLFITHDLRVASNVCDHVAVMRNGEIVEFGETARVFTAPVHAYTRSLLASVPGRSRWGIPGGESSEPAQTL
jgi:peptide/nickel transport system ATP-binding protein